MVWVDGVVSEVLVPGRPALLQQVEGESLVSSAVWLPDTPLPERLAFAEPGLSPRYKRRLWLGATTVAAAGAATGLLLWSDSIAASYVDPDTPYGELDALEKKTTRTSIGGIVAAAAAAGTGVTMVVLW